MIINDTNILERQQLSIQQTVRSMSLTLLQVSRPIPLLYTKQYI